MRHVAKGPQLPRDTSREALIGALLKSGPALAAIGRRQTPRMTSGLVNRNQSSPSPAPEAAPVAGVIRTHWVLSVCVVCGQERTHGERHRASCPTCGAQLRSFALYRDVQAGR